VKLNLGCGNKKIYGFVNVDGREEVNPDVLCDVASISKRFKDVDLIYASHVLEHFPYRANNIYPTTCYELLLDWHKALKVGGTLRLAVPDFAAVSKYYAFTSDLRVLRSFMSGGQKYDFDYHLSCWDFLTLKSDLESLGFKNVKKYDWKTTEHDYVDDYSQSYLPHMDKISGLLMSLNVEAQK
jgi:hypothetical protein